jgi:hypothetical protein
MSRGFLIYAHNNEEIDYGKLALICARMIKSNLRENQVCLVTDSGTISWLRNTVGAEVVSGAFDHIKILDTAFRANSSQRRFQDTKSTQKSLTWYNGSRNSAFELSPFDETIILDSDVLVQDRMFDLVWGNDEDVLINCDAVTLNHIKPKAAERRLDSTGIRMYWATMIYFRKTERAKLLFDLVSHVKEKYPYYQYVYEFPGKLYRNDYAFSIAVHMLNGFLENNEFKPFPQKEILSSFDVDELIDVREDELMFLVNDSVEDWKFRVRNVRGLTVHVMNKYSILRQADKLLEIYK